MMVMALVRALLTLVPCLCAAHPFRHINFEGGRTFSFH